MTYPADAAEQKKMLTGIITAHAYSVLSTRGRRSEADRAAQPMGAGRVDGELVAGIAKVESVAGRWPLLDIKGEGRFWMA